MDASTTVNRLVIPPLFQRLVPEDPAIVGTLLAAVCLLLLDAPECGKPFGSSEVEIMVAREIDRRVLLVHVAVEVGLITCVCWTRIGQAARHSTPVSGGTRGFLCFHPRRLRTLRVLTKSQYVRT